MSKSQLRRERKRRRHKQKKTNTKLKKRLFGHLFMAPCYYCKKVFLVDILTVEHLTPLCLGGTNDPSNIALACLTCNQEKGKESWVLKRELNRQYYEKHSSQHRNQNWQGSLQDP